MNKFICSLAFLCCFYSGFSQVDGDSSGFDYTAELSRAVTIPNSPEAQAFIKYGDIPLNQYTGTPNISIPICEIKGNSISMPISMTYDASGIKVNQLATNVGLGWNLNYGGVVSRQVQGLPDQATGTFAHITDDTTRKGLHAVYNSAPMSAYPTAEDLYYGHALWENYNMNNIDTQADTFSFSINGLSGTIAINYDVIENGKYQVFSIDNPEVQIDYTMHGKHITSWTITDTNGTSYEFAKTEYTLSSYSNQQNEFDAEYISGWYITKIQTANQEDRITYNYGNGQYYLEGQHMPVDVMWQYYYHPTTNQLQKEEIKQHKQTVYQIQQFNPTAIFHNDQLVVGFGSTLSRADLPGQSAITDINVYNTIGQATKSFAFDYSYFVSGISSAVYPIGDKRLKLDAIREIEVLRSSDGSLIPAGTTPEEKTHRFDYFNPTGLPPKSSNAMDLWGYYNGASIQNNNFVLGNTDRFNQQYGIFSPDYEVHGANRKPDISFARNGTLQKITYPTGGSTTFYYDAHRGPVEEDVTPNVVKYSTTVIGGHNNPIQNTNDLNDCPNLDDIPYLHNLQNIANGKFVIDSLNATRNIVFDMTFNNYNPGNQLDPGEVKFVCIYKSQIGTGQCETRPCPDGGLLQIEGCSPDVAGDTYTVCDTGEAPLTYCDIMTSDPNNNPKIVYFSTNPVSDFTLQLEEGDYRILLVDGNPNTSLNIDFDLHHENTTPRINRIGGLRLYKTESKPSETSDDKLTKYYYYNTLPEDKEITPNLAGSIYNSSGVIHQKLVFSKIQMHAGKFISINDSRILEGTRMHKFYSSNLAPKTKFNIAYTNVSEILFNNDQYQGHTTYTFYNDDDGVINQYQPYFSRYHLNGKLRATTHYNNQKQLVRQSSQEYTQQTLSTTMPHNGVFMIPETVFERACITKVDDGANFSTSISIPWFYNGSYCGGSGPLGSATTFFANKYRLKPRWTRLEKQTDKQFFGDQVVEKTTNYFYDNTTHKQVTRTETTKGTNEVIASKTYYPQDVGALTDLSTTNLDAINKLSNQHRIAIPIQTESYLKKGDTTNLLSKTRTHFKDWGAARIYPEMISTQDPMTTNWEERMRYVAYDDQGHPLEVTQTDGSPSIFIWGYNNRYPIAKIANATYTGMPTDLSNLIEQLKVVSNTETSSAKEAEMRTLMVSIRDHNHFKDSQIISYTYDPQIGVTSITDPRGETMYYQYDGFNRLETVKDAEGNLVSENKYHYKN